MTRFWPLSRRRPVVPPSLRCGVAPLALALVPIAAACSSDPAPTPSDGVAGSSPGGTAAAPGSSAGAGNVRGGGAPASGDGGAGAGTRGPGDPGGAPPTMAGGGTSVGGVPAGKVPAFIAQGSLGRTTVSCDGGRSWVHNRSYDLEGSAEVCGKVQTSPHDGGAVGLQCFTKDVTCTSWKRHRSEPAQDTCEDRSPCDCDHHPGADKGIAFGHGVFVATWGWGPRGDVKVSTDGTTWNPVVERSTFAGVAFGAGSFMLAERYPRVSANGTDWAERPRADYEPGNVRDVGFADVDGGVFLLGAASGDVIDLLVSDDLGESWTRPTNHTDCGGDFEAVAGGNGAIIVAHAKKASCVSTDGGATFKLLPDTQLSSVYFTGGRFVGFGDGQRHTSQNGTEWTRDALVVNGDSKVFSPGVTAHDPDSGVFVGVRTGWGAWYDQQYFYRSDDGLTWAVLDKSQFSSSHRVRHMAFGYVDSSTCE